MNNQSNHSLIDHPSLNNLTRSNVVLINTKAQINRSKQPVPVQTDIANVLNGQNRAYPVLLDDQITMAYPVPVSNFNIPNHVRKQFKMVDQPIERTNPIIIIKSN